MKTTRSKGGLRGARLQVLLAAGAMAAGLCLVATTASATPLTVVSVVGGAPTGNNYVNFNDLATGSGGGSAGVVNSAGTATGASVGVAFAPDAQAVMGSAKDVYAAPFLSGGNGAHFGAPTQPNGQDSTVYLVAGSTGADQGAAVTLMLPGSEKYMGLLWGSVDTYNTLAFYNGGTFVGSITGTDVDTVANGNQGAQGTFYVNINSTTPFDKVVATSTQYTFEFDNVAFNVNPVGVPEPAVLGMFGLGLLLIGGFIALRRREWGQA